MLDTLLIAGMTHFAPLNNSTDTAFNAIHERVSVVRLVAFNDEYVTTRDEMQATVPEGTGATVSYTDHQ